MGNGVQLAGSDEQLAARFLEAPELHREAFASRCVELLRVYVRRFVFAGRGLPRSANRETFADDAFSLAEAKLFPALGQLRSAESLHPWLKKIAKSAVVEEWISRTRRTSIPVQEGSLDDIIERAANEPRAARELDAVECGMASYHSCHWPDPEAACIRSELLEILQQIRTQHSVTTDKEFLCGAIIAFHFESELSFQRIAGLLGKPRSTVFDIFHGNMTAYREAYKCMTARRAVRSGEAE